MGPVARRVSVIGKDNVRADKYIIANGYAVGNEGESLDLDTITNGDLVADPDRRVDSTLPADLVGENHAFFRVIDFCHVWENVWLVPIVQSGFLTPNI